MVTMSYIKMFLDVYTKAEDEGRDGRDAIAELFNKMDAEEQEKVKAEFSDLAKKLNDWVKEVSECARSWCADFEEWWSKKGDGVIEDKK
jgi:hypothetical protein